MTQRYIPDCPYYLNALTLVSDLWVWCLRSPDLTLSTEWVDRRRYRRSGRCRRCRRYDRTLTSEFSRRKTWDLRIRRSRCGFRPKLRPDLRDEDRSAPTFSARCAGAKSWTRGSCLSTWRCCTRAGPWISACQKLPPWEQRSWTAPWWSKIPWCLTSQWAWQRCWRQVRSGLNTMKLFCCN